MSVDKIGTIGASADGVLGALDMVGGMLVLRHPFNEDRSFFRPATPEEILSFCDEINQGIREARDRIDCLANKIQRFVLFSQRCESRLLTDGKISVHDVIFGDQIGLVLDMDELDGVLCNVVFTVHGYERMTPAHICRHATRSERETTKARLEVALVDAQNSLAMHYSRLGFWQFVKDANNLKDQ